MNLIHMHRGLLPGVVVLLTLALVGSVSAQALRLNQVRERPLLWPDKIGTTTPLGNNTAEYPVGTEVEFVDFHAQGLLVKFPDDKELTLLRVDMTDLLDRATAQAAKLPEALRSMTLADLANRPDLYPATVRTNQEIEFPDKVREEGRDIGPYRMSRATDGSYVLAAVDPDMAKKGEFQQRQSYTMDQTDFLPQLRAGVLTEAEKPAGEAAAGEAAKSRLLEELNGRLVDAEGGAYPAEQVSKARYFAVYSAAAWCGWCTRYNPELMKAVERIKSRHGDAVQFVFFSNDESGEKMRQYMSQVGMPFPAIRYDARQETPMLLGLTSGSTPQLFVLSADGRLIHDGGPGGASGGNAALRALEQAIARDAR